MLNRILWWSIVQRWLVLLGAIAITLVGVYHLRQMPLDVLPDFAPPQVEIQTEAPGLAPEEVEALITLPIESVVNGTAGVETVRSTSSVGLSVVKVIFDWDTDIYQARQLITERLQAVRDRLPENAAPQISPITSPIATILMYALVLKEPEGDSRLSLMELRQWVDQQFVNRLLAVPGVSQVIAYGGDVPQYQVWVQPERLAAYQVSLAQVTSAVAAANHNAAGGWIMTPDQELIVRGLGRVTSVSDLQEAIVDYRNGQPIRLQDVATVHKGAALARGDGSVNGQRAIILVINKQPFADTPTVTRAVEQAVQEVTASLPEDIQVLETFRQNHFIEQAIANVRNALRDGMIIVSLILFVFLLNWRTALITLSAIPLSLLVGILILSVLGQGINTMTLGGLAVAIGSVVDDSIVDMENCYRGLRRNQVSKHPKPVLEVVYDTSVEVRGSVIFSTVIIAVVFAPIFALTGVEGRIFAPMGLAYLVSIVASTLVAMTLSPALCAILLAPHSLPAAEPWLIRYVQRLYRPLLALAINRPNWILTGAIASVVVSLIVIPHLGREFLPEFQERSLVNAMVLYPGSSLEATNRVGFALQDALKDDPRFTYVQVRAGRAPGDADAGGVNLAHVDVELSDQGLRERDSSIAKLRSEFARLPGVVANVGGFISHRMDEVLSGVRSAIAVKIVGPDLQQLRTLGEAVEAQLRDIDGLVDLQLEPQVPIPQVQILIDRDRASRYGLTVADITNTIETALNGRVVSQVLEGQQLIDVLVWLAPTARQTPEALANLWLDLPNQQRIPLSQVAEIRLGSGPNTINRENVSRLLVVAANVSGRDLRSVINEIQARLRERMTLPQGYFIEYGGQFESEARATQRLVLFSGLAILIIAVLMYFAVKSVPAMLMIMVNLPLALVGGIVAIALSGGVLSVASLVGFITLFGVATRNGLLLVDNYNQKFALGLPLTSVIYEGSMERLVAILMTALTSALGMLPLVWNRGAGGEILQPLAVVVFGGLFTSTALTLLVLPALYRKFGGWLKPKEHCFQKSPL